MTQLTATTIVSGYATRLAAALSGVFVTTSRTEAEEARDTTLLLTNPRAVGDKITLDATLWGDDPEALVATMQVLDYINDLFCATSGVSLEMKVVSETKDPAEARLALIFSGLRIEDPA